MLRAENITVKYSSKTILNNVSLEIKDKDLLTIIGVNGSGKSTLLKILSRNLVPVSGNVFLMNKPIAKIDNKKIAKQMAFLPQNPITPFDLSVRNLVSYGRYPHHNILSRMGKRDSEIIDWAVSAAGVEHLQYRQVSTLSGGERQRAWIALALAQQSKILLLDEPTTALDIAHQLEVLELVKKLNRELGITVVMVLHDINQAVRFSDEIIVLNEQKIFLKGKPDKVISEIMFKDVFNIKVRVLKDEDNNCPYIRTIGKL